MELLESVRRDLVYSWRSLRKRPVFAVAAILTLGLAIGGNTAMFTVIRAVLLKPLSYPDADRLMSISSGATITRFHEMQDTQSSFTAIAAFAGADNVTVTAAGEPEAVKSARVSANFLDVLGVAPQRGRSFRREEDTPGGASVVLVSDEFRRRHWGDSANVTGTDIDVGGIPSTIIGILPPRFGFPFPDLSIWLTRPEEWSQISPRSRALSPFLSIFGRLRPGITRQQANVEMHTLQARYRAAHADMLDAKPKTPEAVVPLKETLVGRLRSMLWMLLGAVGFVLLIACANLAGLLLARANSRVAEMSIRAAIGASRARIVKQLINESIALSLCGGLLGLLIAFVCVRAVPTLTFVDIPRANEVHIDAVVLSFAVLLSLITGVLFGLAPALSASRPDLMQVLRAGGSLPSQQSFSPNASIGLSPRSLLLVAQVALSLVLLISTALMIQSVRRLRGVPIGFDPGNVVTASVMLSPSHYSATGKQAQFFQTLVNRVRYVPGVRSAAAAMTLPMMGYAGSPVQDAAKPALRLNERPIATIDVVTPGYFKTLQIPIRRGRDFNDADDIASSRVVIIDEALARRFWPAYPQGQDPIGQHLLIGYSDPRPSQIIGIVQNIRQDLENTAWPGTAYVAFAQHPQLMAALAVRTQAAPAALTGALRREIRALDKTEGIAEVHTMEQLIDEQVGQRRLLVWLLAAFTGMALLLVVIGLYGVVSYSVAQRTRELGIRRALGAQYFDILRLVLTQSLRLAVVGVAIGMFGAYVLTRLLSSMLFEISPTDPITFLSMAALFILVALLASYLPARRAAAVEPAQSLRL